jgi:hypothetical protein
MELDGGMIAVLTGLQEDQQIVADPGFLMDSESRLRAVNRRFGPATNWTKQMPPMEMPGMKMPGMKHEGPMPGMQHEPPMPGVKHEGAMPGMEHEDQMPAAKGSQP